LNAGPRDAIYYFDQGGNLNAIRWNETAWVLITNLRMDPYERGLEEDGESMKFLAQNIWLLVPIQGKIQGVLRHASRRASAYGCAEQTSTSSFS